MKIAHLADIHLGFRQFHRQTPAGINQRETDVANAFRAAVDDVIREQPDAVIIAGDLFHSVRPTNAAILFAFQQFQRLRHALPNAPVVLVGGNHDTPRSSETGSILELYTQLGVHVAAHEPLRLHFPELDLAVLAVPYEALMGSERPVLRPEGDARYHVLVLHREIEGALPVRRSSVQYEAGASLREEDIAPQEWTYVALGHYHVQHQVSNNTWYAGALEYVTMNPWGELDDESEHGLNGKGWLLVEFVDGKVHATRRPVERVRELIDLDPLDAAGRSAEELSADIDARVQGITEGLANNIVRLVVRNVPRHVARELDHAAIRAYKAEALHFHLDLRRPDAPRRVGVGGPGRRQTLPEQVEDYLSRRPLPAGVDREAFVKAGVALIEATERELAE